MLRSLSKESDLGGSSRSLGNTIRTLASGASRRYDEGNQPLHRNAPVSRRAFRFVNELILLGWRTICP